jgi:hypothetical protein
MEQHLVIATIQKLVESECQQDVFPNKTNDFG